ncbi:membrane metallo-endopeptidase-like 1 isoform X2 [Rhipicephalus microplus]|uniref:membrane metallo-endopeptidase-like 1 isoform X2 n=1 Tax=Rhipicephalus microplus TaxID=6941 RepID=UPI003F6CCCC9
MSTPGTTSAFRHRDNVHRSSRRNNTLSPIGVMKLIFLATLHTWLHLVASKPAHPGKEANYSVCCEEVCYERAKLINESLNTSVEPCEDFYSYACGGWMQRHEIPATQPSIGTFYLLRNELQVTLKGILENMTIVEEAQNITDKLAVAYNACVAVPTERDRIDVLRNVMNHSGFAQWPIKAREAIGNRSEVLKGLPITTFLGFNIARDNGNLSSYAIQINQLAFRLVGRNQLIQPHKNSSKPIIRAYKKLVQSALKIMNANLSHEELEALADTLIHFEGQLANLTTPPEKRRNVLTLYHRTTIDELEKNFTQMPLGYLISKELSEVNITVAGNETIQNLAMDYYRKLDEFLRRANCTTLFNYAGLREVLKWAALASGEFRNASFELTKAVMGVLEEKPRWEVCVHTVNSAMPEIVGYLYVLRKFTEEAKQEVEDIVKRIAAVFNKTIRESEWMDNDTKAAAEFKLSKMGVRIGYPSWLLNVTYLEELYKYIPRLYLNASFLEMYHAIQRNNWMRTLMNLRRPFDKDNTAARPAVVNALYRPTTNEMMYPSGILQGAFYQHGLPRSLNFGAIGGVVGHEMTHGFDDKGSQFDADGALKQWWTNTTRKKFNEKAKCLIYQYGNITDKETNMTAYDAQLKKEGDDIRLPGLTHLSGRELFFIANAMVWCGLSRVEKLRQQIQYDVHSPGPYRANVPMKNFKEFSDVFRCSNNVPMNPEKKCTLW